MPMQKYEPTDLGTAAEMYWEEYEGSDGAIYMLYELHITKPTRTWTLYRGHNERRARRLFEMLKDGELPCRKKIRKTFWEFEYPNQ